MAKILVTGGPVHAMLDSVKMVTNRFKGGRMKALAEELGKRGHNVLYLTARHLVERPKVEGGSWDHMGWGGHEGFEDYRDMVLKVAPEMDMVILGAAVANLIPRPPWGTDQKFPSHDYQEGDVVNVPFEVAPRIINMVKAVAPKTTLVGFKLLQGVPRDELVRAAHLVASESRAAFIVANDANNLGEKLIVTRERSVIPAVDAIAPDMEERGMLEKMGDPLTLVDFLDEVARDEHYESVVFEGIRDSALPLSNDRILAIREAEMVYGMLIERHRSLLEDSGTVGDHVFGCVAVAVEGGGFVISPRGKKTLNEPPVYVERVDQKDRRIWVMGGKASLNAPFLDRLFRNNNVWAIVHTHASQNGECPTVVYAPPGTVRDSQRALPVSVGHTEMVFEVEHHGTFWLLGKGEFHV
jgi:phosphopantothenate-cysteine ligase